TEEVIPEQAVGLHHSASNVKATPAVRALANRMEVELSMVTPSGHDGLILGDDVRRVARILADHGKMEALRGVRRAMARNMAQAHAEVAPATIVDDADITHLQSRADITPTLIHALVAGCRAEPSLNAWYDSHANGRRVLERIHLGLAVDAPQGLFVAVMKDIHEDDQQGIADRLLALKEKIKNRSIKPAECRSSRTRTLSGAGIPQASPPRPTSRPTSARRTGSPSMPSRRLSGFVTNAPRPSRNWNSSTGTRANVQTRL
ncbi:MAG: 2-oxo acid dehydrogenase subunit E2, partial [Candidatus Hydrogenedentes bacterium]|nr:2-oxo acid dehydrogenase subunit E2 [Candidatus Hydrogenedentota bacterium]